MEKLTGLMKQKKAMSLLITKPEHKKTRNMLIKTDN